MRPNLRTGVRLSHDPVRDRPALLYPEGLLLLNDTAAHVVSLCDGTRTVRQIVDDLAREYDGVAVSDVEDLLGDLAARRLIQGHPKADPSQGGSPAGPEPVGMLAEVTYRCPLHCTYCSNPIELSAYGDELSTADWLRVVDEARELGVLQVHFSGGEPMIRADLAELVAQAHQRGMYSNLITSGVPLDEARLTELVGAGLDHLQLSIQDAAPTAADAIAGLRAHERKLAVARLVRRQGIPLTINAVLHRSNVDHLLAIAELAATLGADRLELAHTQYYGWGLRNRAALMPTAEQVERAGRDAAEAVERYGDRMEIVYVVADYHTDRPKPCMSGWGSRQFVVAPNGAVLPCLAAAQLPDLVLENVRRTGLAEIWYASPSFNRFRGTAWMPQPCRGCPLREVDFGGCRCQAYQVTGDASATDPACGLSPHHGRMVELATTGGTEVAVPRRMA